MSVLRTNYANDVLDTTENTHRRYTIKKHSDDSVVESDVYLVDVTEYTSEGDNFGATDINATNTEVNSINLKLTDNDFTITTTWLENTSIGDYTNYPYYQTISTDIFTDESHPDCLVFGADPSAFMTETERDNKSYLCDEVQFTSTGITLLATDPTETALTLRVKGGISSSSPTPSDIQYFYNTDSSVPQCEWHGTPGYLSGTMDTASYYTVYPETGLTVKNEEYLVVERVTTDFVGTKNKIRISVGTSLRGSDVYTWEYKTSKSASNLVLDISSYKGQTIYIQFIINLNAETDVTPSATLTFGNTYLK